MKTSNRMVAFWDVDAPATLDRVRANPQDAFAGLIPRYDFIFTYGGGDPVVHAYQALGARECVPVYNALDTATHYPVPPDQRFACDLAFLGNRLPDREARVEEFFLRAAGLSPDREFLLGGAGWGDKQLPANVRYLDHVYTRDHNAFNCSPRAVLNVSRESMARYGYSPATRVFEAAGAGACLITDAWEGIEISWSHAARCWSRLTERKWRRNWQRLHSPARRRSARQHSGGFWRTHLRASRRAGGGCPGRRGGAAVKIVILGLSVTSSWGNGHATTYRGLIRGLHAHGHEILFLERDTPWYAGNRDQPGMAEAQIEIYSSVTEPMARFEPQVRTADLVIVGSFVPEGIAVGEWVQSVAGGVTAFYGIDTPVTLAALESGACEYLTPALVRRYALYLSFTGGPVLRHIERQYQSPMARVLYCSVDTQLYYPEQREDLWDLGYLGTYSSDRQPVLQRLLLEPARRWPAGRFAVAGPCIRKTSVGLKTLRGPFTSNPSCTGAFTPPSGSRST